MELTLGLVSNSPCKIKNEIAYHYLVKIITQFLEEKTFFGASGLKKGIFFPFCKEIFIFHSFIMLGIYLFDFDSVVVRFILICIFIFPIMKFDIEYTSHAFVQHKMQLRATKRLSHVFCNRFLSRKKYSFDGR